MCAGKLSGRSALRSKLTALGYDLPVEQLDDMFKRFKVGLLRFSYRPFSWMCHCEIGAPTCFKEGAPVLFWPYFGLLSAQA